MEAERGLLINGFGGVKTRCKMCGACSKRKEDGGERKDLVMAQG